jgi:Ca2+-binding RTX toxin-like protein
MSKRTFSATKGTRLGAMLFVLLLTLAALHAFSAKPASAGPNLVLPGNMMSNGGASGLAYCPVPYPNPLNLQESPVALNWTGTDADDSKCGSDYADYMNGAGGSDTLYGLNGDNTLIGGTGNDKLGGYYGSDHMYPGDGQDGVHAGGGNDTIGASADGQPDRFRGGAGTDLLRIGSCSLDSGDELIEIEIVTRPVC